MTEVQLRIQEPRASTTPASECQHEASRLVLMTFSQMTRMMAFIYFPPRRQPSGEERNHPRSWPASARDERTSSPMPEVNQLISTELADNWRAFLDIKRPR